MVKVKGKNLEQGMRKSTFYLLLLTFNLHKTIYQLLPQSVELFWVDRVVWGYARKRKKEKIELYFLLPRAISRLTLGLSSVERGHLLIYYPP